MTCNEDGSTNEYRSGVEAILHTIVEGAVAEIDFGQEGEAVDEAATITVAIPSSQIVNKTWVWRSELGTYRRW